MKEIQLTQGLVSQVDDKDFERLNQHRWCVSNKYALRREGPRPGVVKYLHKEVLQTDQVVDHINGDTFDNRKENLRLANKAKNSMNRLRQRNNTTGFKGVSICKGKYQAYIKKDGVKINLGTFLMPEDAAHAYDKAAIRLFGAFAEVNFPVNKL